MDSLLLHEANLGTERDVCIYCGKEPSKWERNRTQCWSCNEMSTVSYDEMEERECDR